MDTAFTEEQEQMRRTVRDLLARRCGPEEVRAAVLTPEGYDTALWRTLAHDLGLPGLALPERYGGVGCGTLELALAAEEAGRALLPSPLLPTAVLAAPLLLRLGTEEQRAGLLPRLASGELTAALAVPGDALVRALGLTGEADGTDGDGGEDGDDGEGGDGGGGGDARDAGDAGEDGVGGRNGRGPGERRRDGRGRDGRGRDEWGRGGWGGAGGSWAGGGRAGGVQARRAADGWRLYGEAGQVLGGHSANVLLVAAHAGGFARSRTLLFLVGDDAPGLVRSRQTALDETRAVARLRLRDVPAVPLGGGGGVPSDGGTGPEAGPGAEAVPGPEAGLGADGGLGPDVGPVLAGLGPRVAAVLAAEAVGAADGALTRTVSYVTLRRQFGRPIGSFQAVRHRLADVYVQLQAARSAAYYAAWEADTRDGAEGRPGRNGDGRGEGYGLREETRTAGGLALAQGLEALRLAAAETVQLHGGVGFTWEHAAHLVFKRAAGDGLLFGPVHRLRARAAARAGLFAPREGEVIAS
ncbi:acyl-CoA dehydrogenase [Streptomyces albus subsp. chlorinus]|uniref:acyl-CoA dehydrogenase family protein n=1 Tax=Streptomyces albus TaxID=1888 RepID=UPI0015705195|nr:acyl-CoA dehydrogenase family protein [Streptomyces albus]NSC22296.1 acyl-CoA dehydrogenase [Streptomyces albus subsp. chlorinus]